MPDDDIRAEVLEDPERWEKTMADIADVLVDELRQAGIDGACSLGRKLAFALSQALGGTQIYLPRGDAIRRASRDLGIWLEYDGTVMGPDGSVALARRYNLSEIYIYRIIARQRGLHRSETQTALEL
jgi:Mor family transcriptional regulator